MAHFTRKTKGACFTIRQIRKPAVKKEKDLFLKTFSRWN